MQTFSDTFSWMKNCSILFEISWNFVLSGPIERVNIGPGESLTPNRHQTITKSNVDPGHTGPKWVPCIWLKHCELWDLYVTPSPCHHCPPLSLLSVLHVSSVSVSTILHVSILWLQLQHVLWVSAASSPPEALPARTGRSMGIVFTFCQTSNIRCTKSQNSNVSFLVLLLSLPKP